MDIPSNNNFYHIYFEILIDIIIMGAGVLWQGRFSLFVVSYRGEWQLPGTFFRMKNIVPSQTYRILKNSLVIKNLFKP